MNNEKLILETLNEILCIVAEPNRNNSFVAERVENLTTRINEAINPKEEQSLPSKTADALGRKNV